MGEAPVRGMMSSYGDGVYKSTDDGRTWTHIGLEKTRQISHVVLHPTDANIVYVAAQGSRWAPTEDRGIYRSTDGGATWKRILFVSTSAGASELAMDPTNPRVLYATFWDLQRTPWSIRSGGPGSGIWKSTDGGDTWTQLKNGLPSSMGRIGIAIAAVDAESSLRVGGSGFRRVVSVRRRRSELAPNHRQPRIARASVVLHEHHGRSEKRRRRLRSGTLDFSEAPTAARPSA